MIARDQERETTKSGAFGRAQNFRKCVWRHVEENPKSCSDIKEINIFFNNNNNNNKTIFHAQYIEIKNQASIQGIMLKEKISFWSVQSLNTLDYV